VQHPRADFSFAYPSRHAACLLQIRVSEAGYLAWHSIARADRADAPADTSMIVSQRWRCAFGADDPHSMTAQVLEHFFPRHAGLRWESSGLDSGHLHDALLTWFTAAPRREVAPASPRRAIWQD